jgi:hypothetical protein
MGYTTSTIFLDYYVNLILTHIYGLQDLCKYLLYDSADPTAESTISDTKILFDDATNRRISTIPFNIDVVDKDKTVLTVNVNESAMDRKNIYYRDIKMRFFVTCPYGLWQLSSTSGESKTRPNAIIHYLLQLFNRQEIIGLGSTLFTRMYNIYPNQYIGGFCLELESKDFVVNN